MKTPAILIILPISAIFHVSVFASSDSSTVARATVFTNPNLEGDVRNIETDRCISSHTRSWIPHIRSVDVPPAGCVRLCESHSGIENCRFFRHGHSNKNLPSYVHINSICPCSLQSRKRAASDSDELRLPDSPEYPY